MNSPNLQQYKHAVNQFTEGLLKPYLESIRNRPANFGVPKEFNDPVWGTLVLRPHEVTVLDSPILQRLRRIRQLGVAHWVYPAAVHTRFEHSLGVCHQVQRLADSINSHSTDSGAPLVDSETILLMRMTALCHDVGHGLMSHVVENALRNDRACQDLILAFSDETQRDGRNQLSEIAAHYIVVSPAFRELLCESFAKAKLVFDDTMPEKISKIIVGERVSDHLPLLHELISGPFDADKLDYMPRDAAMCGVPTVTDIERLIQKVRAVQLPVERLPAELASIVQSKAGMYTVVGLAPSGASTLDEVSIGRSLMFDKIYRHQKVRAVEAMVSAIIDQLGQYIEPFAPLLPLRIFDDEVITMTEEWLTKRANAARQSIDHTRLSVGLDIVSRLRERQLFMRAFAFSQHMPRDPFRGDPEHRHSMERMIRLTSEPESRKDFVDLVVELLHKMVAAVPESLNLGLVANADPTPYIWVDPPAYSIPDTKPDPNRAYLIDSDGQPHRVDQVNAETRGWSDAYVNTHDMGYVFTIREFVPAVSLAAEIAAHMLYGVRVSAGMQVYSKPDAHSLSQLAEKLGKAGFYSDLPYEVRPKAPILTRADAARRLAGVVSRLQGYAGPGTISSGELTEPLFNTTRVENWVRQFDPELVDAAIRTAEAVRLIGRSDTNRAFSFFFGQARSQGLEGASVVPLGQPKDGSAVVGYHVGDAARRYQCDVRDLGAALCEGSPIVFVDDFIGRGSSAISIVESLLGAEDSQQLHETRPGPLPPRLREELLQRRVEFVFTAGFGSGKSSLEQALARLGFVNFAVYVHIQESDLPSLRGNVLSELREYEVRFMQACQKIGEQLLADDIHDANWRADRVLGYGNQGLLIVFPYNTPTATLTPLWKSGKVDGRDWRPLFPRRQKL